MTSKDKREIAEQLADVFEQMEDLKCKVRAIVDTAKDKGMNVKALRKAAKELLTDSTKLAKQYEDEAQLELFRSALDLYSRKGLAGQPAFMEAAE